MIILLISFLLPIFVLPNINNPLLNSKGLLLFLLSFVTIIIYLLQSFKEKKWLISLNPLLFPSIIFGISVLLSALINHRYPFDQLVGWGGFFLSFITLIIFAPILIKRDYSQKFIQVLNTAGLIIVLGSILQLFNFGFGQILARYSVLNFPNDFSFSLTGGALSNIQLLSILIIANIFDKTNESSWLKKVVTALLILGLGINLYAIMPGKEAQLQLLPISASLSIAKESLALTNRALFGFGPASYVQAFHLLKPMWLNTSDLWQLSFESATIFPLTIIVTGGILAFFSWVFLAIRSYVLVSKKDDKEKTKNSGLKYFIIAGIVWQIISPLNVLMLSLLALAIAFYLASHLSSFKIKKISFQNIFDPFSLQPKNKASLYSFAVVSSLFMAIIIYLAFQVGSNYAAHFASYQATAATENGDINSTFIKQEQARNLASHSAIWRRNYAISSLQIAIAMSNKTDITATEQEQLLTLLNTAITEAKAATVLEPRFYQNWLVLAEIYSELMEITDEATQLTFDALAQASQNNPNDPNIRINLGQFFQRLGQWQYAVTFYTQAVERKPDLPEAYYYLAQAYKANNQILEAEEALQQTLLLIDKETNLEAYTNVENELKAISEEADALRGPTEPQNEIQAEDQEEQTSEELSEEEEANILLDLIQQQEDDTATESGLSNSINEQDASNILREERLVPEEETID
jgi:tetratricopeptide (TPR) repeat protein